MPGKPKPYTPEFKEQAVKKVVDSSPPLTIAEVARELNINDTTLGFWVKAYRKNSQGSLCRPICQTMSGSGSWSAASASSRWKKRFEKSGSVLREGASVTEKYEFIDAEYAILPAEGDAPAVVQMCEWLGVSKSGFYDWGNRPESETAQRRELLKVKVKALFEANNAEYGYRRIHAALVRGGESVDDETVRKVMRDLDLHPCQPKPWRHSLTEQDGQAGPIPDLVNRDFTADKPGQKMVGDITYIDTWEGWVYLATVIDCATRKIAGWAMDDNYKTPLISRAIEMAARNLDLPRGLYSTPTAAAIIPQRSSLRR